MLTMNIHSYMTAYGMAAGAPNGTPEQILVADMEACETATCADCYRTQLTFEPYPRQGQYVSFVVCLNYVKAEEMHNRTLPMPKQTNKLTEPASYASSSLLTAEAVAKLMRMSVRTVWRMRKRSESPQPIRYNRKLIRWSFATLAERFEGQQQGVLR